MPRTKQRTPELRAHVLRVAMSALARDGVAGFTTRRVAEHAATSTPAIYELFGDRGGLVRAMFFDGFRQLRQRFAELEESTDPRGDLAAVLHTFRAFVRDNPVLAQVMFARPFTDFDPAPEEAAIGGSVREFIVGRVARCVDTGVLSGDKTDIAHVLLALAQGMAAQETAGWLGTSQESADRRWSLAIQAALGGLAGPAAACGARESSGRSSGAPPAGRTGLLCHG